MTVFRDWPYLYDGDINYERAYLQHYQTSPEAIVVVAHVGDWVVGAATATPLLDHAAEFAQALDGTGIDIDRTFYCGESVLLPSYRGRGIGHQFFDQREAHARTLGYHHMCFCSVIRPDDHPLRPANYRPLDGFWDKRGYARVPGAVAQFSWKDIDTGTDSQKRLQFWMRRL
ncbi:GNAT family N-acetyltransferase [uncultured Tateyamaria sp.]|nr:GNAT family N-acetyltransferase [uncultured Tateyamaria sp.]